MPNQTNLKTRLLSTLTVTLLGAFAVGSALATDIPASIKALIPAAQKEGAAMVWGITLNPRQIAGMNKGFNEFYGTSINVTHRGGAHGVKAGEIARAYKAGVPTGVDIFWTAAPASVIKAGALVKVDWHKEYGVDPSLQMSDYGITTHNSTATMITVNTTLVKKSEEPRTYDDLLNPKWKGKIAITRSPRPWMQVAYGISEAKAVELLTGLLVNQKAKVLPRIMNVKSRVLGGEYAIGIGTDAFTEIAKGAPVRHPNMDNLLLNTGGAWILKDSKAQNFARIWGFWAVSEEGQKVLHKVRGFSLVKTKGTDLNKYASGRKTHVMPANWRLKNQRRLVKKFSAILKANKNR
ncbi:MAG: ABC transporter substrate-binding protein [Pseudomonadota bacterium]|nr:ABC transporter substrate-binding protein [Pseudomonadota bacterium]